jgi:hypothetical protein
MQTTIDGPKNACSAKWCNTCAAREKRLAEEREADKLDFGEVSDPYDHD